MPIYAPVPKKSTIGEMQKLANLRGGECLSVAYINAHTKLKWMCMAGHVWTAAPNNVKCGYWCQKCHLEKIHALVKHTIGDMRELAKAKGGECLSKDYGGIYVKLRWRCGRGHVWDAAPTNIISGCWCPVCGGKQKLTIGGMRAIAVSRGGSCLSKRYVNSQTKLKWKCREGHVWEAIPASVKQGSWCGRCAAKKRWAHPGSNRRSPLCESDVITN